MPYIRTEFVRQKFKPMAGNPEKKPKQNNLKIAQSNGYEIRKTIRFKGGMSKFLLTESNQTTAGDVSKYIKELIHEKMNQKKKS